MSGRITSGPFFVPLFIDGTSNLPVDRLLIGLKNPTDSSRTVRVIVDRSEDVLFPATAPETIILNQVVTLPADNSTVLTIFAGPTTFQGDNILRVTVVGDTDEDAEGIEVALFGGNDGRPTVSMIFKHEDFIKVDD
ncbi:hypothetical protein [Shimazuella alba]|uniref:Uncharacterized protein n=1 Tax=Shimazuella alba TaxID=2690964 RepID=A0A6I4W3A1_9BACL|nr:hypothetical protein [Shimazuella alba]MXQ55264.1 hypothetical protein [Shimazuella alba]